jgi:uncharacterized protein YraI
MSVDRAEKQVTDEAAEAAEAPGAAVGSETSEASEASGSAVTAEVPEGARAVAALAAVATAATAAATTYPIAPGVQLNVRSGPGTGYTVVRTLPAGSRVAIFCQTPGTSVTGPYGTSKIWDNIGSGEYVSDAYVLTGSDGYVASRCG